LRRVCDTVCGGYVLQTDIYQAYRENSLIGGSPAQLVVALYEGAIEATRNAASCLESGDIWGRSKAISKATNILTELLISLDSESGVQITSNLKRLYAYMQSQLLEAHVKKSKEPLKEVEKLLTTLAGAWRVVAEKTASIADVAVAEAQVDDSTETELDFPNMPSGSYLWEIPETFSRVAYTF
jgi:flagellar protein FliS